MLVTYNRHENKSDMPVRVIPLTRLPKATRQRRSKITLTPEWEAAISKIPSLRKGNALVIEFSPETLKLGRATAQRFKRLLTRELKSTEAKGLRIFFRGRDADGQPVLYIASE
jgi:hypothetical protein